jgi:hypothetical protein
MRDTRALVVEHLAIISNCILLVLGLFGCLESDTGPGCDGSFLTDNFMSAATWTAHRRALGFQLLPRHPSWSLE